jgi:leucyl/phenylalanyl-tRNA--protein transferase
MNLSFPYLDEFDYFQFPPVETAREDGILASGGNLSPGMLISAYKQGIFPWFSKNEPIMWWSPDPRFVLFPENLHIPKRLARLLKKNRFAVIFNERFKEIIRGCRKAYRPGQEGTWITDEMEKAYIKLFDLGYIFCAAVTDNVNGELAGGIYGVKIGNCFFGESMFANIDDASKYGFVKFVLYLADIGVKLIDCQVRTDHLARFGAEMIPRKNFIDLILKLMQE